MIKSHFSHWPPICMFSSWKSNNLINKIHEKSLRVIDDDKESDFQTLQEDHNELTIHQRNLQALMTDVCKRLNGYTPPIVGILFLFRENIHNIRDFQVISNKDIKTARYGLEIICHRTPFRWHVDIHHLVNFYYYTVHTAVLLYISIFTSTLINRKT